jgi:hypothetical protein
MSLKQTARTEVLGTCVEAQRMLKVEDNDLLADTHGILEQAEDLLCLLLIAHGVSDVRQSRKRTSDQSLPEPSTSEVEITIEELKRYESPGVGQIPAEFIQAGGKTSGGEIHCLASSVWKNCHCSGRNISL